MKALTEVGVSAVHVGGSEIVCEENVAAGKFRFGMPTLNCVLSLVCECVHVLLSLYGSGDCS